jgi:hypothetical protein
LLLNIKRCCQLLLVEGELLLGLQSTLKENQRCERISVEENQRWRVGKVREFTLIRFWPSLTSPLSLLYLFKASCSHLYYYKNFAQQKRRSQWSKATEKTINTHISVCVWREEREREREMRWDEHFIFWLQFKREMKYKFCNQTKQTLIFNWHFPSFTCICTHTWTFHLLN